MNTLKLPLAFIRDCIECECDVGQWDGKRITATPDQLAEIKDRARHYAEEGLDAAPPGLIRSAKATLATLERLGL